jgi:hypothetical protein
MLTIVVNPEPIGADLRLYFDDGGADGLLAAGLYLVEGHLAEEHLR